MFKNRRMPIQVAAERNITKATAQPDTSEQPGGKMRRRVVPQTIVFHFPLFTPSAPGSCRAGSASSWAAAAIDVMRRASAVSWRVRRRIWGARRFRAARLAYAETAQARGIKAIIAGAGGAARYQHGCRQTTDPRLGAYRPQQIPARRRFRFYRLIPCKRRTRTTFAIGEAERGKCRIVRHRSSSQRTELAQKLANFRAKQEQAVLV